MSTVNKNADLLDTLGAFAGVLAGGTNRSRSGPDIDSHPKDNKCSGSAELTIAVEQYVAAAEKDRRPAFHLLVKRLKEAKDAGWLDELAAALRLSLTPTLDYTSALSLNRFCKSLPPELRGLSKIKLAIL